MREACESINNLVEHYPLICGDMDHRISCKETMLDSSLKRWGKTISRLEMTAEESTNRESGRDMVEYLKALACVDGLRARGMSLKHEGEDDDEIVDDFHPFNKSKSNDAADNGNNEQECYTFAMTLKQQQQQQQASAGNRKRMLFGGGVAAAAGAQQSAASDDVSRSNSKRPRFVAACRDLL